MTFERVVGLDVIDDDEYQRYREGMMPILKRYGGEFGFDLKVSEVLLSKSRDQINRVFTIEFPSQDIMDEFFSCDDYLAVKEKHFIKAVKSKTLISIHKKII